LSTLKELLITDAQPGRVTWIGLRPAKRAPMITLPEVALLEAGLEGDRSRAGKRALTLFQWEHLDVLASLLGRDTVAPELLRRNLHVAGLNLSSLRGALVRLGNEAVIEITGPCAPCSRMQQALGPGGYNALRGHGGWCARIVQAGPVRLGDSVQRA
jgi:MOSC domain-containing protein YiiM